MSSLLALRRLAVGVAADDNWLYAAGGMLSDNSPTSFVERFDGSTWQSTQSMNVARIAPAAVVFRGLLYIISGKNPSNWLLSVECFDGVKWSAAPSLSRTRHDPVAAIFKDAIYLVGAFDGSPTWNCIEVFNGLAWSSGPCGGKATGSGVAVLLGSLYAFGGQGTLAVERFNGTAWIRDSASMPVSTWGHATFVL
jgi:hypothetical protein